MRASTDPTNKFGTFTVAIRDLRDTDEAQIVYETFIDENNEVFSTGEIIYANLVLRGQSNQLYF